MRSRRCTATEAQTGYLSWAQCKREAVGRYNHYRGIQDSYQHEVGRRFGLARGKIGSKRKHRDVDPEIEIGLRADKLMARERLATDRKIAELEGKAVDDAMELDRLADLEVRARQDRDAWILQKAARQRKRQDLQSLDEATAAARAERDRATARMNVARQELAAEEERAARLKSEVARLRKIRDQVKGSLAELREVLAAELVAIEDDGIVGRMAEQPLRRADGSTRDVVHAARREAKNRGLAPKTRERRPRRPPATGSGPEGR